MYNITYEQIIRNFNIRILSSIELTEPYLSIYNDLESVFKDLYIYKYTTKDGSLTSYLFCKSKCYKNVYIHIRRTKSDTYVNLDYDNIWKSITFESLDCHRDLIYWYIQNFLNINGKLNFDFLSRFKNIFDKDYKLINKYK